MSRFYHAAGVILVSLVLLLTVSAVVSPWIAGYPVDPIDCAKLGWNATPAVLSPPWYLPGHSPAKTGGAPIEPELLRALLEAESTGGDEYFRVILHLHEQADLKAATLGASDATDARSRLVLALQTTAARSQALLRSYLEGAQAAGRVKSFTSFWIFNGVAVHADRDTVFTLATRPEVAVVRLDHYRHWIGSETSLSRDRGVSSQSVEWGVARIRADQVWNSLHISGSGALVAGMDTGVDWLHPALQAGYRGYNPHGPANHAYSWYDATGSGALYPVDGSGHGSHTLGTVVGQGGIGVAPGAQWIGVRVLNSQGYGYDSWIHEGFQWLLAPGGDPLQAPDVVNCSWGNTNGSLTTFQPDLQALQAAGIFAVFSTGNAGPGGSTVGSPASLPGAFAVGATDPDDEVAIFSSRGPSPWGEVRPHVGAPGVDVRSSMPGGAYSLKKGTSMAVPHVTGIVALLRSVSPTLSVTRTAFLITSTAVPLGDSIPNNDSGWGRVDAFAAVVALVQPGYISGTVSQAGSGVSIAGATVVAMPHGGGGGGTAATDAAGKYTLALAPTVYDVTASAFGYQPATAWGIMVATGTTTVQDFSLTPLPAGTLRGRITDASTGLPVTATVTVLHTPREATANSYEFSLPVGTYTVRARSLGYRVVTATASILAGQATVADFALLPAPRILLVDSGRWQYESQAGYFGQALDDLAYAYDECAIKHLPDDIPAAADLSAYDAVIWSAPKDAPGYIGAQGTITNFLSAGGRLLLTGQDVGFFDGGGTVPYWSDYYADYLKARYLGDNAPTRVLEGAADDIFSGLTITIAGAGGADNQDHADEIGVRDSDAAAQVLAYREGDGGGMRVGTCLDYRVVYLSFGFEAINDRAARRKVMDRTLDWLVSPLPTAGLELKPTAQTRIGLPGTTVTHAVRVRHVGQGGSSDTVSLSLEGVSWATQLSAPSLSLAPCTSATVVLSVTIPSTAGWDARDVVTLTARSSVSPALVQTAVLTSKAPAPILLVDDDRWYNQEDKYETALAGAGFRYDYWRTGWAPDEPSQGSPPLNALQRHPILVWFTGYDWFAPVTDEEETTLAAYLDGGGRLLLSSQDFLYYHHRDFVSQVYLGAAAHTEDVTPTQAAGVPGDPIGDRLGLYPLSYPFDNLSDAVVPAPEVAVPFRDQERRPIAVAQQGEGYRTAFFAFPFETLPKAGRAEVMERVVGWLSWLGSSTFAANKSAVSDGDTLTYTLALRNDGPISVTASLSNTLPSNVALVPGSLTGPASYDPSTQRLSWKGALAADSVLTFTYRVTVAVGLPALTPITNTVRLGLEEQGIQFHRAAIVRVDAADLSPSVLGCSPPSARPGTVVTCTLALANAGPANASAATAANLLPEDATLIPDSLALVGGGTVELLTDTVRWTGALAAGIRLTVTYQMTLPANPLHPPVYNVAFLEDGMGGAWERPAWVVVDPWRYYFPAAYKDYFVPQRVHLPVVMKGEP